MGCDLERDGLSELRNRDHLREAPQTHLSHPDIRPGEAALVITAAVCSDAPVCRLSCDVQSDNVPSAVPVRTTDVFGFGLFEQQSGFISEQRRQK